jgi:hypothetical protein
MQERFFLFGFEEVSENIFLRVAMIGLEGCFSGGKHALWWRD